MAAWTCRQFAGKAAQEIVPPRPRNPCWKGLRADSEEKREPVSDFNTGVVDRLKALDPERTIREAAIFVHFAVIGGGLQSWATLSATSWLGIILNVIACFGQCQLR
jgi:hypothetical protein